MTRGDGALITPEVLKWARQLARMTLPIAAARADVLPDELASWESGLASLTVPQARRLARAYEQPFAAFYLPEAPKLRFVPLPDYRRRSAQSNIEDDVDLTLERLRLARQRDHTIEYSGLLGRTIPSFSFTTSLDADPEAVGKALRQTLGLTLKVQHSWREHRKGFNWLRAKVERMNVLVIQMAGLPVDDFRGFSVFEQPLPQVVVNRSDSYSGRAFTLIHEVTHLGLGSGGICNLRPDPRGEAGTRAIETYCNAVAAATLMPKPQMLAHQVVDGREANPEWEDAELAEISRDFGTSPDAVLRRLHTLGLTTKAFYLRKLREFAARRARLAKPGFINVIPNLLSLAGRPFVGLVIDAYANKKISLSEVSDALGVQTKHIDDIARTIGAKA